ncbi:MAG: adenylate/guanylate cyclase domain-containing protein [Vampirovibrionia bacterium]
MLKNNMFKDIKKHKAVTLFLVFLSLTIIVVLNIFFVDKLELMAFDWRLEWRKKPADPNIVCVVIDDYTMKKLSNKTNEGFGRWPWPRPSYSKLLKIISKGDPRLIVVDITLDRDSIEYKNPEFNQEKFIEDLINIPNLFFVHSLTLPEKNLDVYDSKEYKKVFSAPGVVLKYKQKLIEEYYKVGPGELIDNFDFVSKIKDNVRSIPEIQKYLRHYNMPVYITAIYKYAKGIGINTVIPDSDGSLRTIQPVFIYNNRYLTSIHLSVASFLKPEKVIKLNPYEIVFGDTVIPLTQNQSFYLNWRNKAVNDPEISSGKFLLPKSMHYKTIHAYNLLYDDDHKKLINPDIFKDKVVILGVTGGSTNDYFKIPNNNTLFGLEVIATGIDNLLNDTGFIYRVPDWFNVLVIIFIISFIVVIFLYFNVKKSYQTSITYSLVLLILYAGLNLYFFVTYSVWIDLINPILCSIFAMICMISVILIVEKEKRTLVEKTFSKYVSPQIYKQLLSSSEEVTLKTYRDNITVLFTDIRGFTPFTENLSPEEVSTYLNEYFTEMVEVILKHDGTVDKFMGDAIMAFFGAPLYYEDHALKAVTAALEMMETLGRLNTKWNSTGKRTLDIGIGINTGTVLIGNFGSPKLMDYTVIGDTVNLASRLESLNKESATNILISAYTYQLIKNDVEVKILGPKTVKGKSESVVVYELLGLKS